MRSWLLEIKEPNLSDFKKDCPEIAKLADTDVSLISTDDALDLVAQLIDLASEKKSIEGTTHAFRL